MQDISTWSSLSTAEYKVQGTGRCRLEKHSCCHSQNSASCSSQNLQFSPFSTFVSSSAPLLYLLSSLLLSCLSCALYCLTHILQSVLLNLMCYELLFCWLPLCWLFASWNTTSKKTLNSNGDMGQPCLTRCFSLQTTLTSHQLPHTCSIYCVYGQKSTWYNTLA